LPQLRALPLSNVSTRALLGMTCGPSGGGTVADGSYLADLSGYGLAVRVIEYFADVEGREVTHRPRSLS
jgi:hypothetical protein